MSAIHKAQPRLGAMIHPRRWIAKGRVKNDLLARDISQGLLNWLIERAPSAEQEFDHFLPHGKIKTREADNHRPKGSKYPRPSGL